MGALSSLSLVSSLPSALPGRWLRPTLPTQSQHQHSLPFWPPTSRTPVSSTGSLFPPDRRIISLDDVSSSKIRDLSLGLRASVVVTGTNPDGDQPHVHSSPQ